MLQLRDLLVDELARAVAKCPAPLIHLTEEDCNPGLRMRIVDGDDWTEGLLLQLSIHSENWVDLFLGDHFGLIELDGTDSRTRSLISGAVRAVICTGYDERVGRTFGRDSRFGLRLRPGDATVWTRGRWLRAVSSSKRWVRVPPAARR